MSRLWTLAEIAAKYRKTPKTFKKYVLEYDIPHEPLGKSLMFDPVLVSNHLAAIHKEKKEKGKVIRFTRKKVSNTFAERVGI